MFVAHEKVALKRHTSPEVTGTMCMLTGNTARVTGAFSYQVNSSFKVTSAAAPRLMVVHVV